MKRTIVLLFALILILKVVAQKEELSPPEWAKDLIIYELATKGFTSPDGPESGTFNSLKAKIPYLNELGVNGIWLTGHHLCEPRFFYNCWNEYAVLRPDSIDPTLGTEEDFKNLITEFHKNDIKVFLDVITHGVMNNSSLIKEHPDWFRGGSWGMTDFDWEGDQPDLDQWWVDLYTSYALDYGVDGYRLDVNIYRPDLWKQIKQNCKNGGHEIAVWLESDVVCDGACDFLQKQTTLSVQTQGIDVNSQLVQNAARYFDDRFNRDSHYQVEAHYTDGTVQYGFSDNDADHLYWYIPQNQQDTIFRRDMLKVELLYKPDIQPSNEKYDVDEEENYIQLKVDRLKPDKCIDFIKVRTIGYWTTGWQLGSSNEWTTGVSNVESLVLHLKPFVPDVKLYSIQLSSHDDGWIGFPENENPYVAEGSRCLFGYSCLFTPAIPIFYAGEEFDASYKPLPNLAPGLFGEGEPGTGRWLYGSWLQWDQLKQAKHGDMLEDVKKMIRIRKANSDLFYAFKDSLMPNIEALPVQSDAKIPTPYIIWNENKVAIVAGNNTSEDIECTVEIPLDKLGLKSTESYQMRDVWNDRTKKVKGADLQKYQLEIKRDQVKGGGVSVIILEK